MDAFMDHALVCSCGGDRTLRHNAARDAFFRGASEAGLRAEREKPGLLLGRPDEAALRGEKLSAGRRPADVWLAASAGGAPCAVDFAVTSGLRADCLATSSDDCGAVWGAYEEFKRQHLDTAKQCQDQGIAFEPFVLEAHGGGFGAIARRACSRVARAGAARAGDEVEVQATSLLRCISVSIHRENARAVLRRLPPGVAGRDGTCPEAWAEEAVDQWQ